MSKNHHNPNLVRLLQTGLIVGFITTMVGNFLGIVTQSVAGIYYAETSIAALTLTSFCLGIIGSILYFFFHRQLGDHTRDIFTMIGLTLPTLITLYVLSNQYDTAFRIIAVSVSYVISLTVVILIPWLSDKYHVA